VRGISREHPADITDKASLEKAFGAIGKVDAIVSVAGGAVFKPLMRRR
jgi:NADP-dependent 3-hydroxy acid dehydrogenase YdfG